MECTIVLLDDIRNLAPHLSGGNRSELEQEIARRKSVTPRVESRLPKMGYARCLGRCTGNIRSGDTVKPCGSAMRAIVKHRSCRQRKENDNRVEIAVSPTHRGKPNRTLEQIEPLRPVRR